MRGLVAAWLTGEAIIAWRAWKAGGPPMPGQLIAASAIFIMLGLLAQADRARFLATALAWGFDAAALMNVLPQIATGGTNTAKSSAGGGATPKAV